MPAFRQGVDRDAAPDQGLHEPRFELFQGECRPEAVDVQMFEDIREPGAVIGVIVGQDDPRQMPRAEPAEGRDHQPFADVDRRSGQTAAIDQIVAPPQ
jgi:hypothetical protein